MEELHEKFYSISYRVMAGDVLDLPPTQHITIPVVLDPAELRFYLELQADAIAEVKAGTVTAANALVKLLRLAEATSGYSKTDEGVIEQLGTSKKQALDDLLDGLPLHEPCVIFARFKHDLDMARGVAETQGRTVAELSGRKNELREWQAGERDVLVAQIQSGGVGIDLARSAYFVFTSLTWNNADYDQALARPMSAAQKRSVCYYHLIAMGTVDETVQHALRAKKKVVDAVLEKLVE
jgi:SNF2 family DNA or RNA helicase